MPLFSKRIICGLCNKRFKAKLEKGKRKYLCQTYDNGKGCERNVIEESFLTDLLEMRYREDVNQELVDKYADKIIVHKDNIEIEIKNDVPILVTPTFLQINDLG